MLSACSFPISLPKSLSSALLLLSAIGISSGVLVIVLVSMLAYALGFGMAWPSLQAIMTHLGAKETVGKRLGMMQSAFSLAFIFAPLIAGSLLQVFGPQAIFYNGAALMALATVLGFFILQLTIPRSQDSHIHDEVQAESGGFLQRFHH